MKPITYLGFTLLSVLIQFCVMDFIQEKFQMDETFDLNETSHSNVKRDTYQKIIEKPHALYYRKSPNVVSGKDKSSIKYDNSSITEAISTSTDASTRFDLLYDDNISESENDFTTESFFTTTEYDNVTEMTFFDQKVSTTLKPISKPKKTIESLKCNCNLMYKKCDINCCCDADCTDDEKKLFDCIDETCSSNLFLESKNYCYQLSTCNNKLSKSAVDDLLCIDKNNLPEKRNIYVNKVDDFAINNAFKWHINEKKKMLDIFTKKTYKYGDTMRVLKNRSLNVIDLPVSFTSNYCNGRKSIRMYVNENIKCNIKLKELYMFHILEITKETTVISATEHSFNASVLNCSTLFCTNWSIIVCNELKCIDYDKTQHEPTCTETVCKNLALKVELIFYSTDFKITRAVAKLHTRKISTLISYMTQEIIVRFYLGKEAIENTVQFSGNPGYTPGLPVIVSSVDSNRSNDFLHNFGMKNELAYPENEGGRCILNNSSYKIIKFGENKRFKCRVFLDRNNMSLPNGTNTCVRIQNDIKKLLDLDRKVYISPLGNPQDLADDSWISLKEIEETHVYGEYYENKTKLICNNLITRVSFLITYVDVSEVIFKDENKIMNAKADGTPDNVTFYTEDPSTLLTVDIIFIDATKPALYEFAGAPHLSINLPKDFFFPFSSNACANIHCHIYMIASLFIILKLAK